MAVQFGLVSTPPSSLPFPFLFFHTCTSVYVYCRVHPSSHTHHCPYLPFLLVSSFFATPFPLSCIRPLAYLSSPSARSLSHCCLFFVLLPSPRFHPFPYQTKSPRLSLSLDIIFTFRSFFKKRAASYDLEGSIGCVAVWRSPHPDSHPCLVQVISSFFHLTLHYILFQYNGVPS